jgi:allantoin racemase
VERVDLGGRVHDPVRVAVINADGKADPPGAAGPGVDTRLVDLRVGVMPRTPYDRLLCELTTVDAAEGAIADGCDAMFIDSVGDYGIAAIRALTAVPVVGAGEVAIERAARLGRFAIVTVWPPSMAHIYDERLAVVPGGERCLDVHHVFGDDELDRPGGAAAIHRQASTAATDAVTRVVDACRRVAARVDAIVLGCTCMSALAPQVAAVCPVPVIDPSVAGYERAVELASADPTRDADAPATRRAGQVRRLVDGWLEDADPPGESCRFCVTA